MDFDSVRTQILTTKLLQIKNRGLYEEHTNKFAKMFIARDVDVGTTYQTMGETEGDVFKSVEKELEYDGCNVVDKTKNLIRLKTNSYKKHILVELAYRDDDDNGWGSPDEYIRLQVISAKMKKSEYETEPKNWMKMITPEKFYEFDTEDNYYSDSESDDEWDLYDNDHIEE